MSRAELVAIVILIIGVLFVAFNKPSENRQETDLFERMK